MGSVNRFPFTVQLYGIRKAKIEVFCVSSSTYMRCHCTLLQEVNLNRQEKDV